MYYVLFIQKLNDPQIYYGWHSIQTAAKTHKTNPQNTIPICMFYYTTISIYVTLFYIDIMSVVRYVHHTHIAYICIPIASAVTLFWIFRVIYKCTSSSIPTYILPHRSSPYFLTPFHTTELTCIQHYHQHNYIPT